MMEEQLASDQITVQPVDETMGEQMLIEVPMQPLVEVLLPTSLELLIQELPIE